MTDKCENCNRDIPDDEDVLKVTVTLRDKAGAPMGSRLAVSIRHPETGVRK